MSCTVSEGAALSPLHGCNYFCAPEAWEAVQNNHTGIYLEGAEHRDFPSPKVDFPFPRISKLYIENSTTVLEHV